jgi:hypothetical protein
MSNLSNIHLMREEADALLIDAAIEEKHMESISEYREISSEISSYEEKLAVIEENITKNGSSMELEDERDDCIENITDLKTSYAYSLINACIDEFYSQSRDEFTTYKNLPNNKNLLRNLKNKYPHMKRNKINARTKIDMVNAYVYEILSSEIFKHLFLKYIDDHNLRRQSDMDAYFIQCKNSFYRACISKIRGVFKHSQALKTGFCNEQILNAYSEQHSLSICITKNTLEANGQWLTRFIKDLIKIIRSQSSICNTRSSIMIISSRVNRNLKNDVTHCKNMNDAWGYLRRPNHGFKMVFVCSNKTRVLDVLQICKAFQDLKVGHELKLRIFHDEAHNTKEGIPPYRDIVENIIMQPNVSLYIPITSSNGSITCNDNPLWNKSNIENNALNYTSYDQTKSTDPEYSSCSDAIHYSIEDLKKCPEWEDFDENNVSEEIFAIAHKDDNKNIHIRRKYDFCTNMRKYQEKEAMNNGLNVLNINKLLNIDYFIPNKLNLHIISTPCRKIITARLVEHAMKQDYKPIVLGIYGNEGDKYHLSYDDVTRREVSEIMENGEFNTKLNNLLEYLKSENINIERPFIIIGNYTPTGESLSFVNFHYGTIRGNIRLISTNAEEDYQEACRLCYMTTLFIKHNPQFIPPDKYLIGPQQFINNALWYETSNDLRIDTLLSNHVENSTNTPILNNVQCNNNENEDIVASPIKVTVDLTDPRIQSILEILKKERRSPSDKEVVMKTLEECCTDDETETSYVDPSGKFNFDDFTLIDLRCYKKKGVPVRGQWKFTNYNGHHTTKTSFMNDNNKHSKNQCELLSCIDYYIIRDKQTNEIVETNPKTIWWIGYKY